MRRLACAFLLAGCGGGSFDSGYFDVDGGSAELDATGDAAGGSSAGGALIEAGSGGALVEAGGAPGAGGTPSAGGSSTGGVPSAGGAPEAGGAGSGGVPSAGGATGAGGEPPCTEVTHDNGLGQTWTDCVPKSTWNVEQAMKACRAAGAEVCFEQTNIGCGPGTFVTGRDVGIWGVDDWLAGFAIPFPIPSSGCESPCPCDLYKWD